MVTGAVAKAPELDLATSFQGGVGDGLGQVGIMEDLAPSGKGCVGGEKDGFALEVAFVDDLEEDVGGVGELFNEVSSCGKASLESVLDSGVGCWDGVWEDRARPPGHCRPTPRAGAS